MTATVLVVGASGSGKTTLIERLVPALSARGVVVGTIKHASRGFDVDRPGKDSARHFRAGAVATLIAGPDEQVLFRRARLGPLHELVAAFFTDCDLVVAEGFSWERGPRVLVHRAGVVPKEVPSSDETIVAITDEPLGLPVEVAPDDIDAVVEVLMPLVDAGPTRPRG